jgi:hypothetical protein
MRKPFPNDRSCSRLPPPGNGGPIHAEGGTYVGGHYRKQSPDGNPHKNGCIRGFLLLVASPKRSKVIDLIQPLARKLVGVVAKKERKR